MTRTSRVLEVSDAVLQLRKLTEIGRALTYATSLDQVATITVERGPGLLEADAAVLMLSDPDGLLHVRGAHGIAATLVEQFRAPLSEDVAERLRGLFQVPEDWFVAVPLVVGGTVTGLLAVALSAPASPADEWLLSALADQAAVALEGARLGGEVRVEMESRLRASEDATSAKDRALATLAHDIRSPLGAIDGYCVNLRDGLYGATNERQQQALDRIRMSGRHLMSLLDSVMDMARFTAGVPAAPLTCVRLDQVAYEALDILRPAAAARGQTLRVARSGPVQALGNHPRLRQVLVNLAGNAVKFTPDGGTITMRSELAERDGSVQAELSVTDDGPGIAPAEKATIFEAYYRGAGAAAAPGIGLGLAISRILVEQMGGTLGVQSVPGAGATFTVALRTVGDGSPPVDSTSRER